MSSKDWIPFIEKSLGDHDFIWFAAAIVPNFYDLLFDPLNSMGVERKSTRTANFKHKIRRFFDRFRA